jgi:hypothetical protein
MFYPVRCGDPYFNVGHVFTIATRYKKYERLEDYEFPSVVVEQRPVKLTVTHIDFCGRKLNRVGQGLTCGLDVEGDINFDLVGWCLGNEDDFMKVIVA